MKILAIRIRNLASLEGVTEIDFTKEPLQSAGIFAITGPTGAGKSTILDALCLALYAKTPRYSQATENVNVLDVEGATINQKDVRAILRDGTAEGAAEVDFIGIDGNHYKAGWYVRRAGGKPDGRLQGDSMKLENITTRTIIPGKKRETLDDIERLVGLSFEQFTRSVLLAQGEFTAFLKAGKDEKASLLEKLTGIRIYSEISMLIFEKNKQAAQELQLLKQEMGSVMLLAAEDIEDYQAQEKAYKSQIDAGEKQLTGWLKELEWWTQLKDFTESTNLAHLQLEVAKTSSQNAANRVNQLKQVEAVQKTRSWVENLTALKIQIERTNTDTTLVESNLKKSLELLSLAQQTVAASKALVIEKQIEESAAAPLIDKALELDVLIKERNELKDIRSKELDIATNRLQQNVQQLEASEQAALALTATISTIVQWQHTHRQRETIADNVNLIVAKLIDAASFIKELQENELSNTQEEIRLTETTDNKKVLSLELVTIQQEKASATNNLQKITEEIGQINIEGLETDLRKTEKAIDTYRLAADTWNGLYQAMTEHAIQKTKLVTYQSQQKENKTNLELTNQDVKTAETKKQTSEALLKNALLQASENVATLRTSLESGKPCPVCGSLEHPYTKHNPILDNVLKSLEEAHVINEKAYKTSLQLFSSIQQKIKEAENRIAETTIELSAKADGLDALRQQWENHTPQDSALPQADEQKTDWLHTQLKKLSEKKTLLQNQFNELRHQLKTQEAYREQLILAEKNTDRLINQEKDLDRVLASTNERIARLQQEKVKITDQLTATEQLLSPYFSGRDWIDNWKTNASGFVLRIQEFANQWKANREAREKAEREYSLMTAAIAKEKALLDEEKERIAEKEKLLVSAQIAVTKLQQERNKIFDGTPAKPFAQKLADAIVMAEKNAADKQKELDTLTNTHTRLTTQLEQLMQLSEQQHQQQTLYENQITTWLNNYNQTNQTALSPDQLTEILAHTTEWIEQERNALKAIEDNVTKTQTVFEERKRNLTQHEQNRISEQTATALTQLKTAMETQLLREKDQLNEIRLRLRQDEENRKRAGRVQKQITEKQDTAETWAKLNDLVGSADGKKFRQVAQEYTLEVLIAYANVQLNNLSKRYSLQRIPDSLSMQVIDKDMGDEIRTVYSLSGGESFLISLALALGLASLSSNEVKVESLFIDEGFGSLDPITLTTVMDALDRLHNQGRKVGVISHVEEMTERIPAQIKVSKLTNGRSKVETDSRLLLF